MEIWVYSDESGVFDKINNDYFVYGGLILLSDADRQICARKYSHVEKTIKKIRNIIDDVELKANISSNSDKNSLFRSLIILADLVQASCNSRTAVPVLSGR